MAIYDGLNTANDQTWTYDNLNRLTNATAPGAGATTPAGAYAWTYDKVGNRLSEQVGSLTATNYGYTAGTNRLASQSGGTTQSFGYTGSGNLSSATPGSGSAAVFT